PERGVAAVEPAHDRLPLRPAVVAAHERFELLGGLLAHLRRRNAHLLTGRFHTGLYLGDADKIVHQHDRFTDRLTARQQAGVAQPQRFGGPGVAAEPLALLEIDRDALEVVIADAVVEHHGVLAEIAQAVRMRGQYHAGRAVDVRDRVDVRTHVEN